MDISGIPPPVMNWNSSNLPEPWDRFEMHAELIFSGPLKDKTEEEKVSYMLLWIGDEGRQIYRTWTLEADDRKKLQTYYDKFKSHVQPKLNPIFARYQFMNEIQGNDSIDAYVTRLRNKARDGNFSDTEEMLRDRIVFGCASPKVREKRINEGEKLTLDKAIQIKQNFEYCQKQLYSMGTAASQQPVDAVRDSKCPSNWQLVDGVCFYYEDETEVTWVQAEKLCREKYNAQLIVIHSPDVYNEIKAFMDNSDPKLQIWVGGKRGMNDEFTWIDGLPVQETFWDNDEPNNVGGNENCLEFFWEGLNDVSCSSKRKFICEINGSVSHNCNSDDMHEEHNNNCTSTAIHNILIDVNMKVTNAKEILDKLSEATSTTNESSLLVGDLDVVNEIMSKITDIINTSATDLYNITDKFLEVGSNVLSEDTTAIWQTSVREKNTGAESVLERIDRYAEKVFSAQLVRKMEITKANLYLKAGQASTCQNKIHFPNRMDPSEIPDWAKHSLDHIETPCGDNINLTTYSALMYRNLSELMSVKSINGSEAVQINAPVLSFSLHPNQKRSLEKPISLTFGLYNKNLGHPNCSYWSVNERTWSTEGCWMESYNTEENTVTCECNHLTNFAILMSPSFRAIDADHVALSMITIIGCVLSMICLCLTIIMYVLFWHYIKSVRSIIHINLSCSLFIAYLLFITGVDQTQNKVLCKVIAVSLHLVLMIVFFTMLVEGLNLAYLVLNPISRRKPGIPLQIGAYILSFIVVGVSLAVCFDGYGGERFCWLSFEDDLVWGFIGPAIFVFVVNIIIIVTVLWRMYGTSFMSRRSGNEKVRTAVRNIALLMPTLGLSWILGIFSVNEDTVVFQYLFAIFNSLQGLLIFIVHVVLNTKMREAVKNNYNKWQSRQIILTGGKTSTNQKIASTSM